MKGRAHIWLGACFVVGLLVRLAVTYPAHRYNADADNIVNALCAFEVLRGETPVFAVAQRLGSAGCHLTAGLFATFGVSRTALATGPLIFTCLLLPAWYLFLRELLGARAAACALPFVALPSPAFTFWSYAPNTYPELLLFGGVVLWLAARLARGDEHPLTACGLGIAAGLGWWTSMLSLAVTAPALAWLLWRRPRLLLDRRLAFPAIVGGLLGAAPWWLYNLRYPLASFRGNFATRATTEASSWLDNVRYQLSDNLPTLLAGPPIPSGAEMIPSWLTVAVVSLVVLAAGHGLVTAFSTGDEATMRQSALVLAIAVGVTVLLLNVASEAGTRRGLTVRYVLPLYLVVPAVLGLFFERVTRHSKALAVALAAPILSLHLLGTFFPWTAVRQQLAEVTAHEGQLLDVLQTEKVDAVLGNFWQVYSLNFLSQERIRGLPLAPRDDLERIVSTLPETAVRWAFLARHASDFAPCRELTGLAGREIQVNATYRLFLPTASEPPHKFLDRVRKACHDRNARRTGGWVQLAAPTLFDDGFETGDTARWPRRPAQSQPQSR